MQKIKSWFLNLSRIAKLSVISALVLGGLFYASATTPPSSPAIESQQGVKAPSEPVKKPVVSQVTEKELVPIPYDKTSRTDGSIVKGETRIETVGIDGEKTITHTITLTDRVETSRTSEEVITKLPVSEVTLVGTYVAPRYVAPAPKPSQQSSTYYQNCTAARAAGAAPVYAGQPGYGAHLDRDDDGIGCE